MLSEEHTVRHLIVLSLENRSFDHIFARRFNPDRALWTTPPLQVAVDPPHQFVDVQAQLRGEWSAPWKGAAPSPTADLRRFAYTPAQLPIITALADHFVLFDRWFSAVPGPTWPNRYFMHAGTSGGLVLSPDPTDVPALLRGNRYDWAGALGYEFRNGTVFDALDRVGATWRIYTGDWLPQTISLHGMPAKYVFAKLHGGTAFRRFEHLSGDLAKPDFPNYAFIEPHWDFKHDYLYGNSEHPIGNIAEGEALLKRLYEAVRNSRYWDTCAILVLYDEHGGFFDHVPPGTTVPTGDDERYASPEHPFDFRRLGFRVPAILISPRVERGLVDSTHYDHSAVPLLLAELFGIPRLTPRVAHQPSLARLFDGKIRDDTPRELPQVFRDRAALMQSRRPEPDRGALSLAMLVDSALGSCIEPSHCRALRSPVVAARYVEDVRARLQART
ncbi:MAG TPA: alkaline phosphatase family protein [Candidatus Acidoferrales bacterium]|nr:alkaline phosphatase family protein [Candidatus Acidoferrales bacterium]